MKWFFGINDFSNYFENYSQLIKVAVYTANKNTTLEPFCIYDGQENELTKWLRENNVDIIFHRSPHYQQLKQSFPHALPTAAGAFLRVEIPKIVEIKGIKDEYVLYTDCDVMFFNDVVDYLQNLTCKYFAIAPQENPNDWVNQVNTGVMYMNTRNLLDVHEDFNKFIAQNLGELLKQSYDQGAYKRYFRGKWDRLDLTMNWKPYWKINQEIKILHFHGPKPLRSQLETIKNNQLPSNHPYITMGLINDNFWYQTRVWQEAYQLMIEQGKTELTLKNKGIDIPSSRLQQIKGEMNLYLTALTHIKKELAKFRIT
ncbi:MAG: hypothetical protein F6K40_04045 [Okeania sp. SIO3I5]|uniref:hypothetical protein n=1 Tax=Okeania sp. SIO3I5 TaxID=2607805 RepID=UPI0013B8B770|nr:hypothetical protein [Okeania sp. SIO3I5]NEQ35515.1 hypothetical protein [Okeania sp. SIO3I5]